MDAYGAIIFLPRESGSETPLLFEDILFTPGAVWLSEALKASGVTHFFVVCHGDDRAEAAALFPQGAEFVTAGTDDARARLLAFLERPGRLIAVTQPVFMTHAAIQRVRAGQAASSESGADTHGVFELTEAGRRAIAQEGADFLTALRAHCPQYEDCFIHVDEGNLFHGLQTIAQQHSVRRLQSAGVRFVDPHQAYIDPTVAVGAGTVFLPGSILRGNTVVGKNCEIGPNAMIRDCVIGDNVTVNASQLNESWVDDGAKVGPFAYMRPNCRVGKDVKVGDFVELKNSTVGDGTKISHLTYVGDSDVGGRVNFGCGTVTVNYDGSAKFRTTIGDNAFIGCNTNLVAPVKIGDGAYTAAGSTITDDVPADSLAIARSPQTIKVQWAAKRKRAKGKR